VPGEDISTDAVQEIGRQRCEHDVGQRVGVDVGRAADRSRATCRCQKRYDPTR
jgi:hypothetical protein